MTTPLSFSLELFPPRTPEGKLKLPDTVSKLAALGPAFFSVTFGAGGSDQDGTYETVVSVAKQTGIETVPHLTCVGSTRAGIGALLDRYRDAGVRRIVALRGDLPATAVTTEAPGEFHYASELVSFIRDRHGEDFKLEVAAYPEMHPQASDADADFQHFQHKIGCGAHGAVTQYFFNPEAYFDFAARCSAAGISTPIVPGIMPIINYTQLMRFSNACGAEVPRFLRLRLERLQDDKAGLIEYGLEVSIRLCERLLAGGAPGLHIYTLNQAEPAIRLWRGLGLAEASKPA